MDDLIGPHGARNPVQQQSGDAFPQRGLIDVDRRERRFRRCGAAARPISPMLAMAIPAFLRYDVLLQRYGQPVLHRLYLQRPKW